MIFFHFILIAYFTNADFIPRMLPLSCLICHCGVWWYPSRPLVYNWYVISEIDECLRSMRRRSSSWMDFNHQCRRLVIKASDSIFLAMGCTKMKHLVDGGHSILVSGFRSDFLLVGSLLCLCLRINSWISLLRQMPLAGRPFGWGQSGGSVQMP